jgi:DNA helicase HerA-like ATPase
MNAEHGANRLESRLLSMLRVGEMLRFSFVNQGEARMAVSLEGSADERDGLMQRISTILQASRDEGFVFSDGADFPVGNCWIGSDGADGLSVEIVPHTQSLSRLRRAPLGFTSTAFSIDAGENDLLIVPDFPASSSPRLLSYPAALLEGCPAIHALQIEFTRLSMKEPLAKLVAGALEDDILLRREIHGAELPATAKSSFLALWWSRRSGWIVRCRVILKNEEAVPTGVLEVLGREIFGAECRIVSEIERSPEHDRAEASLGEAYPDGWHFPALLPPAGNSGGISAKRIHNLRIPVLPDSGVLAGIADGREVRIPNASRDRHLYIAGATGTGKSTLLLRLIKADLKRKEGLVLLDPHGDLYHEILASIPKNRRNDLLTIDSTDGKSGQVAFNVLDFPRDRFLKRRAEFLVGELIRFFQETWNKTDAFGPMFETYFRNALRLMIHQESKLLTLMDFERVFADREFRKELLSQCTDERVRRFWTDLAEKTAGEASLANVAPYITSKVSILTQSGFVSDLIGQPKDELRLEERINCGGIVLVNLNKGLLGTNESRLLGVLLTMQIFAAGLKRSILPVRERRPVNVYIDEFQNFVSDNVASMLSEARKFGLRMNLANQTLSQLNAGGGSQNLLETVLGNVGNMIVFRLGVPDAERLKPFLKPFTPEQIQEMPNYHALVRLLDQEGPIGPFVMKTIPA